MRVLSQQVEYILDLGNILWCVIFAVVNFCFHTMPSQQFFFFLVFGVFFQYCLIWNIYASILFWKAHSFLLFSSTTTSVFVLRFSFCVLAIFFIFRFFAKQLVCYAFELLAKKMYPAPWKWVEDNLNFVYCCIRQRNLINVWRTIIDPSSIWTCMSCVHLGKRVSKQIKTIYGSCHRFH